MRDLFRGSTFGEKCLLGWCLRGERHGSCDGQWQMIDCQGLIQVWSTII